MNRSDHVHPIPGSNATVNKCGHCYTDPKEAKLFINNCGTCRNEPCCSEGDLDPCGNCPGQGTIMIPNISFHEFWKIIKKHRGKSSQI